MSRIATCFTQLQSTSRKALIPFITTGDPSLNLTVPLMHALVAGGANVIELGVPFSDPMADGPVIQRASERALANGVGLKDCLQVVREFRQTNQNTPIVLMGYANPIERMGIDHFIAQCVEVGVDGVLVVDYPPEASSEFSQKLRAANLDLIFLIAPTSTPERIAKIAKQATGYIYYVSLKGVTGAGHLDLTEIANKIPQLREHTNLPIGVGFGIRDAQTAQAIGQFADGVVIGSRIIQLIENTPPEQVLNVVQHFIEGIRQALDTKN